MKQIFVTIEKLKLKLISEGAPFQPPVLTRYLQDIQNRYSTNYVYIQRNQDKTPCRKNLTDFGLSCTLVVNS